MRHRASSRLARALCGLLALLAARALAPLPATAQPAAAPTGSPALPLDSPLFARRPPPPGQLGYFQAIRFIGDGMRYADPYAGFAVSGFGEMCFYTRPRSPRSVYESHYSYWCILPEQVERVEALANGGGGPDYVRLWCGHPYPNCARRLYDPGFVADRRWTSNDIVVASVANQAERVALEDLVLIMGGYLGPPLAVLPAPP